MHFVKACQEREEAREAAHELVESLDSFLELEDRVGAIRRREESRKAVLGMLNPIAEILSYICNSVSSGTSGASS